MHAQIPMMNFRLQLRLIALVLGLGLMGALIVAVTLSSQRQADEVRSHLAQLEPGKL